MRNADEILTWTQEQVDAGKNYSEVLQVITIEILTDIRTLLSHPPCNCAITKTDGEAEHWPTCRYA